jgi:hypothetical protein
VLGPLPVLLVPVAHLLRLDAGDALRTSTYQVRYLLTTVAPALFALLPGALNAALVLKRYLPESRAPGLIILVAAPACAAVYLLLLGVLTQVAFHRELYLGLLLLACSPAVPLVAARRFLRRDTPERAARLVRTVGAVRAVVVALAAVLLAGWAGDHPLLRAWLGRVHPVWVAGVAAGMLASMWLTTVVVTDVLVSMLYQGLEAARSLAGTAAEDSLTRKINALGDSFRPAAPPAG